MAGTEVSLTDAAHVLKRSYTATLRLVLTGELPGRRNGRRWMVSAMGIKAYRARCRRAA